MRRGREGEGRMLVGKRRNKLGLATENSELLVHETKQPQPKIFGVAVVCWAEGTLWVLKQLRFVRDGLRSAEEPLVPEITFPSPVSVKRCRSHNVDLCSVYSQTSL